MTRHCDHAEDKGMGSQSVCSGWGMTVPRYSLLTKALDSYWQSINVAKADMVSCQKGIVVGAR